MMGSSATYGDSMSARFREVLRTAWPLAVAFVGCGNDESSSATAATIYATVSSTDEVVAIDDETHKVRRSYRVGKGPAILLTTPDRAKLYTANWADDSVSVIDLGSNRVTEIELGSRPYVIAMDPLGRHVWAGLQNGNIAVISVETDAEERRFATSQLPASIIASPDGKVLYVAYLGLGITPGSLVALDAETGAELRPRLSVGQSPAWITAKHDGTRVYTLNFVSDDVTVVNTETWSVEATVSTGSGSQGIIGNVTPDDSRLYLTSHGSSSLVAIDTTTNEIVQTIGLGGRPVGVNFSEDGLRVYTTDFGPTSKNAPVQLDYLLTGQYSATGNGELSVFGVASGARVGDTVELGAGPTSVVVLPAR
jgi:YVTN family beta-propeller protein